MKVILNDFVDGLGERGDVVTVKPGYARNYLLPKRLAYLDTPANMRRFEEEQTQWVEMDLERSSAAEKMAEAMTGVELLFERRAGEKDVLFGSVSVADVTSGLADKGFEVERRRIRLAHPIKELGSFEVPVQIHRELVVTIPVHVVRPGEEPGSVEPKPVVDEAEVVEAVVETAAETVVEATVEGAVEPEEQEV